MTGKEKMISFLQSQSIEYWVTMGCPGNFGLIDAIGCGQGHILCTECWEQAFTEEYKEENK